MILRALTWSLLLAGCHQGAVDGHRATRTVRDGIGREVVLPESVRRVVTLAPSATEILFAVGAGPLVVGVDRYSDFPPEVARCERVGADVDPSLERIVALKPDVVFTATTANNQRTAETLARLGIPVYVSAADHLDEILDDVARIGGVVGRGAPGTALAAALRARLDAVARRVAGAARTRALVVVWAEPLIVAGRGSHVDEMVRAAGGENLAADSGQGYPTYSLERLLARAPEVIVVGSHSDADPAGVLRARLATVPAARSGRIFPVDGDLVFRPGPRVVDGVELLARLFHP